MNKRFSINTKKEISSFIKCMRLFILELQIEELTPDEYLPNEEEEELSDKEENFEIEKLKLNENNTTTKSKPRDSQRLKISIIKRQNQQKINTQLISYLKSPNLENLHYDVFYYDNSNIEIKLNAIYRLPTLISLANNDEIYIIFIPLIIKMIILIDDELVYAIVENLEFLIDNVDLSDDRCLYRIIDLLFCIFIKDLDLIRIKGLSLLSKFIKKISDQHTIIYKTLDDSITFFINMIDDLYIISDSKDFFKFLFLNSKSKETKNFYLDNSKNTLSNPYNKDNQHKESLYKKNVSIKQIDKKEESIKDLFVKFPFLPGKISCTSIIPILYEKSTSFYQKSYLFYVLTRIIKENQSNILIREGIKGLNLVLEIIKDQLILSIDYINNNSKDYNDIHLSSNKILLDNLLDILLYCNRLEVANRVLLSSSFANTLIIFYILEKIENYDENQLFKKTYMKNILYNNRIKRDSVINSIDNYTRLDNEFDNDTLDSNIDINSMNMNSMNMNLTKDKNEFSKKKQTKQRSLSIQYGVDLDSNSKVKKNSQILSVYDYIIIKRKSMGLNNHNLHIKKQNIEPKSESNSSLFEKDSLTIQDINNESNENDNKNPSINSMEIEIDIFIEDFLILYLNSLKDDNWKIRLSSVKVFSTIISLLSNIFYIRLKNRFYNLNEKFNNEGESGIFDFILEFNKFKYIFMTLMEGFFHMLQDNIKEIKSSSIKELVYLYPSLITLVNNINSLFDYHIKEYLHIPNEVFNNISKNIPLVLLINSVSKRVLTSLNSIIIYKESDYLVKSYMCKLLVFIINLLPYDTFFDMSTLIIDSLIKDNQLEVKLEVTSILFEIFKFGNESLVKSKPKIHEHNNHKLNQQRQSVKNVFGKKVSSSYTTSFMNSNPNKYSVYIKDFEHISIIKRFYDDKDSRVRKNILKVISMFGMTYGEEVFEDNFSDLFFNYLTDKSNDVREEGVVLLKNLGLHFENPEFMIGYGYNKILHTLNMNKDKYKIRIICLKSLIVYSNFIQIGDFRKHFLKIVVGFLDDPLVNIRVITLKEVFKISHFFDEPSKVILKNRLLQEVREKINDDNSLLYDNDNVNYIEDKEKESHKNIEFIFNKDEDEEVVYEVKRLLQSFI